MCCSYLTAACSIVTGHPWLLIVLTCAVHANTRLPLLVMPPMFVIVYYHIRQCRYSIQSLLTRSRHLPESCSYVCEIFLTTFPACCSVFIKYYSAQNRFSAFTYPFPNTPWFTTAPLTWIGTWADSQRSMLRRMYCSFTVFTSFANWCETSSFM